MTLLQRKTFEKAHGRFVNIHISVKFWRAAYHMCAFSCYFLVQVERQSFLEKTQVHHGEKQYGVFGICSKISYCAITLHDVNSRQNQKPSFLTDIENVRYCHCICTFWDISMRRIGDFLIKLKGPKTHWTHSKSTHLNF